MRANEVRPYGKDEKSVGKERDAGDSVLSTEGGTQAAVEEGSASYGREGQTVGRKHEEKEVPHEKKKKTIFNPIFIFFKRYFEKNLVQ
jgi:hypothetical protein